MDHLCLGVEEAVIHVDIDDKGSVVNLLAGDVQGFGVFLLIDKTEELAASGNIAALAHIIIYSNLSHSAVGNLMDVKAGKEHVIVGGCGTMRSLSIGYGDVTGNKLVGGTAASADDVHKAFVDELGYLGYHGVGGFVILAKFVGHSRIRIGADIVWCLLTKLFYIGLHLGSAEGTVQTDGEDGV